MFYCSTPGPPRPPCVGGASRYCNGADQCGLMCVQSILLDKLQTDQYVAVPVVVGAIKAIRPQVIPTEDQYKCLYATLRLAQELQVKPSQLTHHTTPGVGPTNADPTGDVYCNVGSLEGVTSSRERNTRPGVTATALNSGRAEGCLPSTSLQQQSSRSSPSSAAQSSPQNHNQQSQPDAQIINEPAEEIKAHAHTANSQTQNSDDKVEYSNYAAQNSDALVEYSVPKTPNSDHAVEYSIPVARNSDIEVEYSIPKAQNFDAVAQKPETIAEYSNFFDQNSETVAEYGNFASLQNQL
ncbi:hypothetical protein EGW08_003381 [Elysia chlorotica]|uniref:Tyrosine-protein phosphatase domain-containing protein n=1 Tax=Elysia chlorotica TaxID=188477 RepID=A0A433U4T3_ELYCH|nr:hypothetical protein EGW08_003381 [Elysia chlorotica]